MSTSAPGPDLSGRVVVTGSSSGIGRQAAGVGPARMGSGRIDVLADNAGSMLGHPEAARKPWEPSERLGAEATAPT